VIVKKASRKIRFLMIHGQFKEMMMMMMMNWGRNNERKGEKGRKKVKK
jgi:hypothetical protein